MDNLEYLRSNAAQFCKKKLHIPEWAATKDITRRPGKDFNIARNLTTLYLVTVFGAESLPNGVPEPFPLNFFVSHLPLVRFMGLFSLKEGQLIFDQILEADHPITARHLSNMILLIEVTGRLPLPQGVSTFALKTFLSQDASVRLISHQSIALTDEYLAQKLTRLI